MSIASMLYFCREIP